GCHSLDLDQYRLPLCLQLTPVSLPLLPCSHTRNIYKWTFRPSASEKEVVWVMRITTIIISYLSAGIAISVGSIYYLSYLCSDLVYVILFPQLLLIVHWSRGVTTYGCLASYIVGLSLRVLGGEKDIGLEPVISYPYFDSETNTQVFRSERLR
ncbi:high-affinity choline transporter 1-like, partial [Homalodisca vitripennis]|uniref:high-affinity choline transporter 1-like n=1 Tax=Homalodisca vitripennis TaxID=197043 RepID=UPI001EECDAFF